MPLTRLKSPEAAARWLSPWTVLEGDTDTDALARLLLGREWR